MFVSVRRYRDQPARSALCRALEADLLPRLSNMPGFIAYYAVESGEGELTTISVFSTADMAAESNQQAAAFMRQYDPANPPTPVEIVAGRLSIASPPIHG